MRNGIRLTIAAVVLSCGAALAAADGFDHGYGAYAALLSRHVRPPVVDYATLVADRGSLDQVVAAFDSPASRAERGWTRGERMAFWINAYNLFTLRAVVDHYPIRSGWFTRQPRNSIRQIDGVWDELTWRAAGRTVTLDDIEHRILRPEFKDARIHFAINCASVSCPPLAVDPYRAATLDDQLDAAARAYLGSAQGVQVRGATLRVSRLFKWYGDDFIPGYGSVAPGARDPKERAILGAIVRDGPPAAAAIARQGAAIGFLDYDWSLNDVRR